MSWKRCPVEGAFGYVVEARINLGREHATRGWQWRVRAQRLKRSWCTIAAGTARTYSGAKEMARSIVLGDQLDMRHRNALMGGGPSEVDR